MANILLVDDNGSVLLTLAIALRRRGHTVAVATDGITALQELKTRQFDFLVSDVRMPGMSGIELATAAHALPHTPRIILTSAYSSIESREGLAEALLRKPIDTEQLDALLQREAQPQAQPQKTEQGIKALIREVEQGPLGHFKPAFG
jgi:CheY-like chemotaxis protein